MLGLILLLLAFLVLAYMLYKEETGTDCLCIVRASATELPPQCTDCLIGTVSRHGTVINKALVATAPMRILFGDPSSDPYIWNRINPLKALKTKSPFLTDIRGSGTRAIQEFFKTQTQVRLPVVYEEKLK